MKYFAAPLTHWATGLTLGLTLALGIASGHQPAQALDAGEVQILVQPRASKTEAGLHAAFAARHGREHSRISSLGVRVVRVPASEAAELLAALSKDADIEYAEPDAKAEAFLTANDPYLTNGTEWHLGKISAPSAWDVTTGVSTIIVAVVDSGVNTTHPDLVGKVLSTGYDFVSNVATMTDPNGHGTAVAGTIAPDANNALGVVGVTWGTVILPVRVLDATGTGSYSAIASGITYAADHGARIINLSLGGTTVSTTLQNAVNYAWGKGCVLIASAGNNGNNVPTYPAACTNVVAVSSTSSADTVSTWSSYGSFVKVSAPGENIASLYSADQYALWSGTSFSSPIVAGVVALMASANPALTNAQLVATLTKNCDDLGAAGYDVYYGYGRVNAAKAVSAAKNGGNADTTAPVPNIVLSPTSTTLAGTVSVAFSATDNVCVSRIELYVDGVILAQYSAASATISLNTTGYADGAHTLQVRAYDAVGNVGTKSLSVTIKNDTKPPVTVITSPAAGTKLTGTSVTISASATDNVRVARIDMYIDAKLFGSVTTTSTASFVWSLSKVASGTHTLQAYGYDASGNCGQSSIVSVTK